ncbi:MAG: lysylphosphatidylglycerol synthase domain-containing protein [Sulfitobacter sp.]
MTRVLRIIGTLIALTCIGVLIAQQAQNLPTLDLTSPALWGWLGIGLIGYVLSQCAAAEAWRSILSLWGVQIAPHMARGQPMVSQIGKYTPGNVAHLFGRLMLAKKDGVNAGIVAASMVMEVAITLAVGLGTAVLLLVALPDALPNLTARYPELATRLVPVSAGVLGAIGIGVGAIFLKSRLNAIDVARPSTAALMRPVALHLASFGILGVSLWATAQAIAPATAPGIVTSTLIFAVAWAVGFVVPGAPGGIGVRDSIIVLGLAVSVGEGSGLAIAILHRGVSVLGDVTTFGIGWRLRRPRSEAISKNRPEPASFPAI